MSFFDWVRGDKPIEPEKKKKKKQTDALFALTTHDTGHMSRDEMDRRSFVIPHFPEAEMAMDSGNNPAATKNIFSLSNSPLSDALLSWYSAQGFIGYQTCAIIAQHWLVNKACAAPGKDATRNGWEVSVAGDDSGDIAKMLTCADVDLCVSQNLSQYSHFLRVFGVRIALFVVESNDPEYYEKPFNIDGVLPGSYKGISQVDPYWCAPLLDNESVSDPAAKDFYEPEYWMIGGRKFHRSHLIITRYSEVPDILKPAYFYGGIPLTQMIYERVYCAERTANEAPQLTMTKRMNVRKTDLQKVVTQPERTRMAIEAQAYYRDNYGQLLINKEDEYEQHETSLADLDAVIMTQYQLVAAVAGVPVTELLGTTPKGFNATGEFEKRSYDKSLRSVQKHELEPLLTRHYLLMGKSYVEPETGVMPDFVIAWNPTDEPSENELADIRLKTGQYYATLRDTGAISGDDIAQALEKDPSSGFDSVNPESDFYAEEEGQGAELPGFGREAIQP